MDLIWSAFSDELAKLAAPGVDVGKIIGKIGPVDKARYLAEGLKDRAADYLSTPTGGSFAGLFGKTKGKALRNTAAIGAGYGALRGAIAGESDPQKREALKEKQGPIGRFAVDNPAAAGALVGGATFPMMLTAKSPLTAIGGPIATTAGLRLADHALYSREQRKK